MLHTAWGSCITKTSLGPGNHIVIKRVLTAEVRGVANMKKEDKETMIRKTIYDHMIVDLTQLICKIHRTIV